VFVEPRINRRQQGDLGEASAIEWLTRQGAVVFAPIGHSPDVDLVACFRNSALRIQVKTTIRRVAEPEPRWSVLIATRGGNQSWSGTAKLFNRSAADYLFVLTGSGRRWFIPSTDLQGTTALKLGGARYSEFEIAPTDGIEGLVLRPENEALESDAARGSVGVWRAERDCKFRALALSEFESHLPHQTARGVTRVSSRHQVTIPLSPFHAAGLEPGDRLRVSAAGEGAIELMRIAPRYDEGPRPSGPSGCSSPFES
jgi:Holliday junction resolvase-like predicted endonuclease